MEEEFKCLLERYVSLQRLRNDLIKLKVEHKYAKKKLQYYLQVGNMELAKIVSDRVNILFEEIKATEKEIKKLKSL